MWRFGVSTWCLIGFYVSANRVDSRWGEERKAKICSKVFCSGVVLFWSVIVGFQTESFTLSGIISVAKRTSEHNPYWRAWYHHGRYNSIRYLSFHRWLLSAMTALNAGFSIDACRFCKRFRNFISLILHRSICLEYVNHPLYLGGLTAVTAQFTKLLQVKCEAN
jgi:NAD(P)H-quinone oxidoreductase subunit 5